MKNNVMVIVASLLSILFMTFHLTDDALRQQPGTFKVVGTVLIFGVWVSGTVLVAARPWAYVITLIGGLFAAAMLVVHSPGGTVNPASGFFFIWTMFVLTVTGWLAMLLSARGLWLAYLARSVDRPAGRHD